MRRITILTLSAGALGSLLFYWYATIGYLDHPFPLPNFFARGLKLDGAAAENADLLEVWLAFFAIAGMALFALSWLARRVSGSPHTRL